MQEMVADSVLQRCQQRTRITTTPLSRPTSPLRFLTGKLAMSLPLQPIRNRPSRLPKSTKVNPRSRARPPLPATAVLSKIRMMVSGRMRPHRGWRGFYHVGSYGSGSSSRSGFQSLSIDITVFRAGNERRELLRQKGLHISAAHAFESSSGNGESRITQTQTESKPAIETSKRRNARNARSVSSQHSRLEVAGVGHARAYSKENWLIADHSLDREKTHNCDFAQSGHGARGSEAL
jgi:hypothetical protein